MLPWENTEGPLGRDRYLEVFLEEMTSMLRAGKVKRREKGDRGRKEHVRVSWYEYGSFGKWKDNRTGLGKIVKSIRKYCPTQGPERSGSHKVQVLDSI